MNLHRCYVPEIVPIEALEPLLKVWRGAELPDEFSTPSRVVRG